MSLYGLTGRHLEEKLIETHIYPELVTGNLVMCMTGIGNTEEDYKRLLDALTEISMHCEIKDFAPTPSQEFTVKRSRQHAIPRFSERVPATESFDRVCASSIIPYPPGIPLICPGEVIDRDVMTYAIEMRNKGENVMGIDGHGRVLVGKETE